MSLSEGSSWSKLGAEEQTLQVYNEDTLMYSSDRNWLYPLLDFEIFLQSIPGDPSRMVVYDKVVGKAAALFLIHLGIRQVEAGILSEPGKLALERYQVRFSYHQLVERISCKTEEILLEEFDPQVAYDLVKTRAKKSESIGD